MKVLLGAAGLSAAPAQGAVRCIYWAVFFLSITVSLRILIAAPQAQPPKATEGASRIALKPNDRVLFVGDSTTVGGTRPFGFVKLIQQAFDEQRADDKLTATGRGYWAASSEALRDAVMFVEKMKQKPTLVVIYFGLNDSKSGDDPKALEAYAKNLRDAVKALKDDGIDSVICTPTVWRTMKQTAPYADVARRTGDELKTPVLDLWNAFDRHIRAVGTFKEGEFAHLKGLSTTVDPTCDGVHHGALGNRIIAAEFLKAVGMKPQWQKFPVTVALGNVDRNIGYPPRGKGTITIEPKKDFYQMGEKVELSVKPDDGQVFFGWRGSIESKEPTVTYTVDGPAFIEAIVEAPLKKK